MNAVLTANQGGSGRGRRRHPATGVVTAPTIVGSTLSENTVTGDGGAIWAGTSVPVTIQRSRIHGNTAAVDELLRHRDGVRLDALGHQRQQPAARDEPAAGAAPGRRRA